MKKLTALYKSTMRLIFGFEFICRHDNADGTSKIFHCKSYEEAITWVSCALNDSAVTVIDRSGYFVCKRFPIANYYTSN